MNNVYVMKCIMFNVDRGIFLCVLTLNKCSATGMPPQGFRCAATMFQVCREFVYEITYSHVIVRKRQNFFIITIRNTHTLVHHR
jgi:hypothetical protein